jgi:SAM-dependent methyltransferase
MVKRGCATLAPMGQYALLLLPSANRVYTDAAVDLSLAELELFSQSVLGGRIAELARTTLGGVPYLTFTANELTERDGAFLANASAMYALFECRGELLRPVRLSPLGRFDDDLVTIQKYPGKTNEQFTKLLLNVTLLSSSFAGEMLDGRLRVLDPVCGRGTTLNQALTYGYDAAGLDIDARDFEAYGAFIRTYLKRKRIKHRAQSGPVRRDRRVVARRLNVRLGETKDRYRSGDTISLDVVNADTTRALDFFRPETFHVVVADAPYGVQHGSTTRTFGLVRTPLDLLRAAAPVWARLLRPGGAMGLAWNTHVARREDAADILAAAGLSVLDSGPYQGFRHRVDQAITRDILIARKSAPD